MNGTDALVSTMIAGLFVSAAAPAADDAFTVPAWPCPGNTLPPARWLPEARERGAGGLDRLRA